MKITVIGAGAMGLRYGVLLQQAGNDVDFADTWDENVRAIRDRGGVIVRRDGRDPQLVPITVHYPEEIHEAPDLAIVFVKCMHTTEVVGRCRHFLGENTYVLTNQNGVGGAEAIAEFVPPERIIAGTAIIASVLLGPGEVDFIGERGAGSVNLVMMAGEPGRAIHEVADEMERALMNPTIHTDYRATVWTKLLLNSVVNTLCTLMGITMGEFGAFPDSERLTRELVEEGCDAIEADGIHLWLDRDEVVDQILTASRVGNPLHHPSMHQDMISGRPTEVDYINGAIVRLATRHGLPAPRHAQLVELVHLKEYARRFDPAAATRVPAGAGAAHPA